MIWKLIQVIVAILCLGAAIVVLRNNGLPNQDVKSLRSGTAAFDRCIDSRFQGASIHAAIAYFRKLHAGTSLRSDRTQLLGDLVPTLSRGNDAAASPVPSLIPSRPGLLASTLVRASYLWENGLKTWGSLLPCCLIQKLEVASRYAIRGVPTTILLDSRMTVQKIHFGPVSAKQLLQEVDDLIKGS